MQVAQLADDRRLHREAGRRPPMVPRVVAAQPRRQTTGFEPFLIAALLGLCLWALILTPIFL